MLREGAGMDRKVTLVIRNGEGIHREGDGMVRNLTEMNRKRLECSERLNY
jgi:hypothetical protein